MSIYADPENYEDAFALQDDYTHRRGIFADLDLIEQRYDREIEAETKFRKAYPEDKE